MPDREDLSLPRMCGDDPMMPMVRSRDTLFAPHVRG